MVAPRHMRGWHSSTARRNCWLAMAAISSASMKGEEERGAMRGLVLDGVCQRDDLIQLPRLCTAVLCRRLKIPTDKLDKTKWRIPVLF